MNGRSNLEILPPGGIGAASVGLRRQPEGQRFITVP
jgi:hypothetical protein